MANKVVGFFKEVQGELARVSWPSKHELFGSALIVITLTFMLSVFVGGVDFILSMVIRYLVR